VKAADFYIWAVERAVELRGSGCEGGVLLRAQQVLEALRGGDLNRQTELCLEIERAFLHVSGLDGLDHSLMHAAWGALALHTGYRTGSFYLDDYLGNIAGTKAFRVFEATAARGMGLADGRRHRASTKYFEQRGAARDNAKAAELQVVRAHRSAAGLQESKG